MENSHLPIARKEGLVIQEMPEEVLVYNLETNKAHCLNQTAALVWKSCDGKKSVIDITRSLEKELKTSVPEDLVWLALDQLGKDELLENKPATKFSGLSRREVIKRVGLASVIALPIVASLVAPTAAQASTCSGAGNTTPCTGCAAGNNCICCNGTCSNPGTC